MDVGYYLSDTTTYLTLSILTMDFVGNYVMLDTI